MAIVTIDNVGFSADDLLKFLKLNNEFDEILDGFVRHKVSAMAAAKKGVTVTEKELQQGADDFRRLLGLHRAKETMDWLTNQKLSVEDLEQYLGEQLTKKKVLDEVTSDAKIEEYFKLNSPRFDEVIVKSIVVDSLGKANELIAELKDDPAQFDELARAHSLDEDSKNNGGLIPKVRRGSLPDEIEAKIFNAEVGTVTGPFQMDGENLYQILKVESVLAASLDEATKSEIGQLLYDEWQSARVNDFQIIAE